ncbi:MAG: autotransporter assembly complex protein TamA, partial [Gammaproteobacteria bacterium]
MKLPSLSWIRILTNAVLCLGLFAASAAWAEVRVVVQGLDDELRANVLALLTVQRERAAEDLSEGRVRRYFERGPREIREALEPFGYYAAQIDSELRRAGDGWVAEFRIQPGAPVRFTVPDVRIAGAGAEDPELRKAVAALDIRPGEPARHGRYEAARSRLQNLAFERGYLDAQYTRRELRIDTAARSAEAILHLDTGPQFRFGEISFNYAGLNEDLVRRYLPFRPGDPYSNRSLLELQRALEDSDYFARVDVVPQREQATDHVVPV